MIDRTTCQPSSAETLRPLPRSRERYATPRVVVDERIRRFAAARAYAALDAGAAGRVR